MFNKSKTINVRHTTLKYRQTPVGATEWRNSYIHKENRTDGQHCVR